MENFLKSLPTGNARFMFSLCLLVGAFVIYKFCLDQFDKPTANNDESDPWKFVVPRNQTPPRQFLIGFSLYCAAMIAIFLTISIIGPGPFYEISKALVAAAAQIENPPAATSTSTTLQNYPTFPILVAFFIVGLNPNLHLPKILDFEIGIRMFALRMAYIPKNMNRIFNHMRFSEFDLSNDKIDEAWSAIDLRRLAINTQDLKNVMPVFNRAVMLYARAATLAGDLNFEGAKDLQQDLDLDVFKQYREEIQNVGINLQAIHSRLAESDDTKAGDIRKAQRDMIKNLEKLYVIFACAVTVKGNERMSDRLRMIGFTSPYPPRDQIPWDPVLKVMGSAAVVLLLACVIAANTFLGGNHQTLIPTDFPSITQQLVIILIVHVFAIVQALGLRTRLIGQEEYFSETGKGLALAYVKIFVKCAFISLISYLLLYSPNVLSVFAPASVPQDLGQSSPTAAQLVRDYLFSSLVWSIVPAWCGVMTAFMLDRPSNTRVDRSVSGGIEGAVMAAAALLAISLTLGNSASMEVRGYYIVLYGGLGFVLGYLLPVALRRYWNAREARLPEKISVLRTAVRQYFHDIQQFSEWLNTRDGRLEGRRPLDILAEESGLQQLTSFVAASRTKISPALA